MEVQMPPPPPPPPPFFGEITSSQSTIPPPPPLPPMAPTESQVTTTVATTTAAPAPSQDRIWLHPWSSTEMRQQASNWSLAGDAGLLLYLEQFSDKLVQRADAIHQHLSQTVNAVKSTHIRVQNCLNEFTSLANTQFIENRVYDEDETINAQGSKKDEQSTEKPAVSTNEAQEKVLQRYVEAIQCGLSILDTHFERVEAKSDNIPNSASSSHEDDDDGVGMPIEPIFEPKDPYILRPLPYLIGTTEFMQNDDVGLRVNVFDEDPNVFGAQKEEETESITSSSDTELELSEHAVTTAPIVPAGASRPDLQNVTVSAPRKYSFSDSGDEDNPFGGNTGPKFVVSAPTNPVSADGLLSKPTVTTKFQTPDAEEDDNENDLFGIPVKKPSPLVQNSKDTFDNESPTSNELAEPPENNITEDTSTAPAPSKMLSELEKAVLRRRKVMNKSDQEANSSESDTDVKKQKPSVNKPQLSTISNITAPPVIKPPTVIKESPRPPIFTDNIPDNDEGDDLFSNEPKSKPISNVTSPQIAKVLPNKQTPLISPPKKEKDIFDNDSDEENDPFNIGKQNIATTIKKNDSNSKVQPAVTNKSTPITRPEENKDDDEELFVPASKTVPTAPKLNNTAKTTLSSSDDDLFEALTASKTKPTPTKITKSSESEIPIVASKPSVQQPAAPSIPSPAVRTPVPTSTVKSTVALSDADSDEDLFGITKTKPNSSTSVAQNVTSSPTITVNNNSSNKSVTKPQVIGDEVPKATPPTTTGRNDNRLSNESDTKSSATTKDSRKVATPLKPTDDDDDDELFGTKTTVQIKKNDGEKNSKIYSPMSNQLKTSTTTISSPAPPKPTTVTMSKTEVDEDPLFGPRAPVTISPESTSVKQTLPPIVETEKKPTLDSDEEEPSLPRKINTAALKDGEKPNVKDLSSRLGINLNAHKPGTRPKTHSITEETPKSEVIADDKPIRKEDAAPPAVKTLPKLNIDSDDDDDDDLFKTKTKKTTPISTTDQKSPMKDDIEKLSVKDISSRIKIPPMSPSASTQSKPVSHNKNESNDIAEITSAVTSKEESAAEKTVSDMLKDRTKLVAKGRTPRSRPSRSGATASASPSNENDDLFGLPDSPKAVQTPSPVAVSVTSTPSFVTIPSPTPVTGLSDTTSTATAAAAKTISDKHTNLKEKKPFSLFDSDDSDIDELLFGFNKKKKSPAASKITTTDQPSTTPKTTTKPSALSLDDDDVDFLSKRPPKKNAKPIDNDDIFADIKPKSQPVNKAKKDWSIMDKTVTIDTDDIFNDTATKSSNSSKPKSTNVKNKSSKELDDPFDDPLNISSKR